MAYLAQPVIVRSPNVNDLDGGLDANPPAVNLSGNIVRSSHYIPDPSSGSPSTDPYTLHPTLKSLPYPLALPPVVNTSTTIATSGADLANFEEDEEDADTEDSRSLLSSITYESLGDNVLAPSTSPSNLIGSFRESTNAMPGSSGSHGPLRGQSSLLANVRPSPYSPVTYHRIPVGAAHTYPVIPTVPGAAVAGSYPIDGNGNGPSSSMLVSNRIPGTRVQVENENVGTRREHDREAPSSEECNVCHLHLSVSPSRLQSQQSPIASPTSQNNAIISTCPERHAYHIQCFQTSLLQPALECTTLPACLAPCSEHIPAHRFLHALSGETKNRYLRKEMELLMMDGENDS